MTSFADLATTPSYAWRQVLVDLAWPMVTVIGIAFAYLFAARVLGPKWLRDLFSRIRRVKAFQVEIELAEPAARETKRAVEDVFHAYRVVIQDAMDLSVHNSRVVDIFRQVCIEIEVGLSVSPQSQARFTLHVPDPLFVDGLYQLIDYYPVGPGRGRAFSTRYGIIGKAWRSGTTQVFNPTKLTPAVLIAEWGMTYDQAKSAGVGRQSFAAVVIPDKGGTKLGVLYGDAELEHCFTASSGQDLATYITGVASRRGLDSALENCLKAVKHSPQIKVFSD